jgi:sRNA-binding regulator protein Hfq
VLRGFNAYEIVMETNGKTMMIFKHAISIIEPNNTKKLALWRGEDR